MRGEPDPWLGPRERSRTRHEASTCSTPAPHPPTSCIHRRRGLLLPLPPGRTHTSHRGQASGDSCCWSIPAPLGKQCLSQDTHRWVTGKHGVAFSQGLGSSRWFTVADVTLQSQVTENTWGGGQVCRGAAPHPTSAPGTGKDARSPLWAPDQAETKGRHWGCTLRPSPGPVDPQLSVPQAGAAHPQSRPTMPWAPGGHPRLCVGDAGFAEAENRAKH